MARSRYNKRAAARSGAQARRMGAARIAAAGRASDRGARAGNQRSRMASTFEMGARQNAAAAGRGFASGARGGATRNQRNVRRQVERAIGEGASH